LPFVFICHTNGQAMSDVGWWIHSTNDSKHERVRMKKRFQSGNSTVIEHLDRYSKMFDRFLRKDIRFDLCYRGERIVENKSQEYTSLENRVYLFQTNSFCFYKEKKTENLPKTSKRTGYGKCLFVQCFIPWTVDVTIRSEPSSAESFFFYFKTKSFFFSFLKIGEQVCLVDQIWDVCSLRFEFEVMHNLLLERRIRLNRLRNLLFYVLVYLHWKSIVDVLKLLNEMCCSLVFVEVTTNEICE